MVYLNYVLLTDVLSIIGDRTSLSTLLRHALSLNPHYPKAVAHSLEQSSLRCLAVPPSSDRPLVMSSLHLSARDKEVLREEQRHVLELRENFGEKDRSLLEHGVTAW